MPKLKLTQAIVNGLEAPDPSGKQVLHWDADLKGFGVLCSGKTGAKTYVVQRDINGNTRRITVGPVNVLALAKAKDKAIGLLAEFADGLDPKKRRKEEAEQERRERAEAITLKMALDDYAATRIDLRPKSIGETKAIVRRYFKDWEDRPLRDLDRAAIVAKHRDIKLHIDPDETPDPRTGAVKGGVAANAAMRVVRGLYNHAKLSVPTLPENPVSGIAWYPEVRRTGMVRPTEMQKFYDAVRAHANKVAGDYIILVLFTGLRREEAAALTWSEVDFAERVIRLPPGRTKASRPLDLPMSDVVFKLLGDRRKLGEIAGGWVFPAASKSGHISEPRFVLDDIAETTGIDVTVHDLRRTFITIAESCEISAFALKGLVNHSMGGDVTAGYIVGGVERLRGPMQAVTDKLKVLCSLDVSTIAGLRGVI